MDGGALEQSRLVMSDAHRQEVDGIAPIIQALAALPEVSRPLHVRVVKDLLWVVTEFRPGYPHKLAGVRWRTPAAHDFVQTRQTKAVRHEHVVERDWMARKLLEHPGIVAEALWEYPCALVTSGEHDRLSRTAWGWRRYLDSGTLVIDAATGEPADLTEMAGALDATYARLGLRP
jgi:hypothetical protein